MFQDQNAVIKNWYNLNPHPDTDTKQEKSIKTKGGVENKTEQAESQEDSSFTVVVNQASPKQSEQNINVKDKQEAEE